MSSERITRHFASVLSSLLGAIAAVEPSYFLHSMYLEYGVHFSPATHHGHVKPWIVILEKNQVLCIAKSDHSLTSFLI